MVRLYKLKVVHVLEFELPCCCTEVTDELSMVRSRKYNSTIYDVGGSCVFTVMTPRNLYWK